MSDNKKQQLESEIKVLWIKIKNMIEDINQLEDRRLELIKQLDELNQSELDSTKA